MAQVRRHRSLNATDSQADSSDFGTPEPAKHGGSSLPRNLDHRELVQVVMKVQRQLDKPGLIAPDAISANLDLVESDLTGLPPGEHVEEAAARAD